MATLSSSSSLRIAVVQFAPKIGDVHANIAKARELCRGLTPRSIDLMCFPEMIFSGYMFPDAPSIAPYLEHPETGPTSTFCAEMARRLECYVATGYPERLSSPASSPSPSVPLSSSPSPSSSSPSPPSPSPSSSPSSPSPSAPTQHIGANSALLYSPTGHRLHTYHKSNLFPTDRTWARPGPGFSAVDLPAPLGRTAIAICNDLNVSAGQTWVSLIGGPYELAGWCVRADVRTVVLLNAWLKPEEEGGEGEGRMGSEDNADGNADDEDDDELEPHWRVLNYWAMRLRPLWADDAGEDDARVHGPGLGSGSGLARAVQGQGQGQRERVIIVCNRCGHERGKTFVGSSAVFAMRPGLGRPQLLHTMGEREEGVGVWTVKIGSPAQT